MPTEPDQPISWADAIPATDPDGAAAGRRAVDGRRADRDDSAEDDPLFDDELAPDDEPAPSDGISAVDLFLSLVDAATERVLDRPIRPRMKVSPAGMLRGEIDVFKIEIPAFLASGLVLDRFVVRAERLRVVPGIPPRLRAGPVTLKAIVDQENLDRWTRTTHVPFRLQLAPHGVVVSTGLAGIRVGEIEVDLAVAGPFVRLRPRRATMLGLPAPLVRFLRGYLPLPPLPRGAKLHRVEPSEGELAVTFLIDEVDEPMTPQIAQRLTRFFRLPLPSLPRT